MLDPNASRKLVSVVFIALMLCSTFAGVVSAGNAMDESDTLSETPCCDDSSSISGYGDSASSNERFDYAVENEGLTEGYGSSIVRFDRTEQSDFLISSQGNLVVQYGNPHGLSWEEFFDLYERAYKAADEHGRPEFKQIADFELNKRLNRLSNKSISPTEPSI